MKNNRDGNHGHNEPGALSSPKKNNTKDDNNNDNLFNHVIVQEHKCSFKIWMCIKSTI